MSFRIDNDPQCSIQSLAEFNSLASPLEQALFSENSIQNPILRSTGSANRGDRTFFSTSSKVSQASKRNISEISAMAKSQEKRLQTVLHDPSPSRLSLLDFEVEPSSQSSSSSLSSASFANKWPGLNLRIELPNTNNSTDFPTEAPLLSPTDEWTSYAEQNFSSQSSSSSQLDDLLAELPLELDLGKEASGPFSAPSAASDFSAQPSLQNSGSSFERQNFFSQPRSSFPPAIEALPSYLVRENGIGPENQSQDSRAPKANYSPKDMIDAVEMVLAGEKPVKVRNFFEDRGIHIPESSLRTRVKATRIERERAQTFSSYSGENSALVMGMEENGTELRNTQFNWPELNRSIDEARAIAVLAEMSLQSTAPSNVSFEELSVRTTSQSSGSTQASFPTGTQQMEGSRFPSELLRPKRKEPASASETISAASSLESSCPSIDEDPSSLNPKRFRSMEREDTNEGEESLPSGENRALAMAMEENGTELRNTHFNWPELNRPIDEARANAVLAEMPLELTAPPNVSFEELSVRTTSQSSGSTQASFPTGTHQMEGSRSPFDLLRPKRKEPASASETISAASSLESSCPSIDEDPSSLSPKRLRSTEREDTNEGEECLHLNISKFMRARIQKQSEEVFLNSTQSEDLPSEVLESSPDDIAPSSFKRLRRNRQGTAQRRTPSIVANASSRRVKKLRSFVAGISSSASPSHSRLDKKTKKKTGPVSTTIKVGSDLFRGILDQAKKNVQRTFETYRSRLSMSLTTFMEHVAKHKKEETERSHVSLVEQNAGLFSGSGPIQKDSAEFRQVLAEAAVLGKGAPTYEKYKSRLGMSLIQFQRHVRAWREGTGAYSKQSLYAESIVPAIDDESGPIEEGSELFNQILDIGSGYRMGNSTYEKYKPRLSMSRASFFNLMNKRKEASSSANQPENSEVENSDANLETEDSTPILEGSELFDQILQEASGYRMVNSVFRKYEHRLKMSRATFQSRVNDRKEKQSTQSLPPSETVDRSKLAEAVDEALRENVDKVFKRRNKELGITFDVFRKEVWIEKVNRNPLAEHSFPGFYFSKKEIERISSPKCRKDAEEYRKIHNQRVKESRAKKAKMKKS